MPLEQPDHSGHLGGQNTPQVSLKETRVSYFGTCQLVRVTMGTMVGRIVASQNTHALVSEPVNVLSYMPAATVGMLLGIRIIRPGRYLG